jgi:hypothetical protein
MKRYEYDRDLGEDIPVEMKRVDFQFFLDTVTSSYLHNLNECNEEELNLTNGEDGLFDMNEYYEKTEQVY